MPLVSLAVLFLVGCAAQSPPHPPRLERPVAVRDLTATQVSSTIELSFTRPDRATDGDLLTKPLQIEIFRSLTLAGTKPGPEPASNPAVTLQGGDLARHTMGMKIEYADELSPADFGRLAGSALTYRVRGFTRGFRGRPIESDVSNAAAIRLLDVPQPVEGLTLEVTEKAIDLSWSVTAKTLTGRPAGSIAGYRVYRSTAGPGETGKPRPYRLLGEGRETSYADSNFEFGHYYSYKVRALVEQNGETAESQDSGAVEVVPRDTFPPAAPAGLTGLYTAGAVELIWNANLEPDLAGYNIYRREAEAQAERLNPELLRSPLYKDSTAMSGHRYFYRVTAVDLSGNESGPSPEVEVEVPKG